MAAVVIRLAQRWAGDSSTWRGERRTQDNQARWDSAASSAGPGQLVSKLEGCLRLVAHCMSTQD